MQYSGASAFNTPVRAWDGVVNIKVNGEAEDLWLGLDSVLVKVS